MSERFFDDLKRLVAVRSVKGSAEDNAPYGAGPREALSVAADIVKEHGFTPHIVDDAALYFDYNDAPETLLAILAHLDVVDEGDGWETDPYVLAEKDGKYFGRGTSDDKGPALCALHAMSVLRSEGVKLKKNVRVIFGSDEESGSDDLKRYFAAHKPPKYLFSPDAQYPVVNTEKGQCVIKLSSQYAALQHGVVSIKGGAAFNIVPNFAQAVIKGLRPHDIKTIVADTQSRTGVTFDMSAAPDGVKIDAKGLSAHASVPDEGINALTALIQLLSRLPIGEAAAYSKLSELIPHGETDGTSLGISCEDELSGKLTLSPTIITGDSRGFTVTCDVRIPVTQDSVTEKIPDRVGTINIETSSKVLGHHVSPDSPLVKALNSAYESVSGFKGGCVSTGGGTYVHDMERFGCEGVAFGASLPDTDTHIHAANEFAVKDELMMSVNIFKEAIKNICG